MSKEPEMNFFLVHLVQGFKLGGKFLGPLLNKFQFQSKAFITTIIIVDDIKFAKNIDPFLLELGLKPRNFDVTFFDK